MNDRYKEIIDHPHHVSDHRPQMSMEKRAAQFSPFKAMVGYEDEVDDTVRTVESEVAAEIERETFYD